MTGHKAWLMLAAPLCYVFVFCTVSIRITNNLISLDPLIQMNNRGQLQQYIDQESNLYREGLKTYVIMIDVNDFKSIDDTFGHTEGDRTFIRLPADRRQVSEPRSAVSDGCVECLSVFCPVQRDRCRSVLRQRPVSAELNSASAGLEFSVDKPPEV